jgi:Na+/H+ antiporter NhaD/arsenite permease-like protein
MTTQQVAAREVPSVQTNAWAIAAFVLSLMGMYGSPLLSTIFAVVALHQVKRRGQSGSGLAIAALAVSAAMTALHVAMWVKYGHPNFELLATAHW